MGNKLSEIIKELEDNGAIEDFYIHRNWGNGKIELNLEFKNDIADEILNSKDVKEIDSCAYWE